MRERARCDAYYLVQRNSKKDNVAEGVEAAAPSAAGHLTIGERRQVDAIAGENNSAARHVNSLCQSC